MERLLRYEDVKSLGGWGRLAGPDCVHRQQIDILSSEQLQNIDNLNGCFTFTECNLFIFLKCTLNTRIRPSLTVICSNISTCYLLTFYRLKDSLIKREINQWIIRKCKYILVAANIILNSIKT